MNPYDKIICIESEALYQLIEEMAERLLEKHNAPEKEWISGEEVMELLGIKSDTTLRKLRNEGEFTFSQFSKKHIMYNSESVFAFLERKSYPSFY